MPNQIPKNPNPSPHLIKVEDTLFDYNQAVYDADTLRDWFIANKWTPTRAAAAVCATVALLALNERPVGGVEKGFDSLLAAIKAVFAEASAVEGRTS